MKKKIVFYISGHGFGHATRNLAIIQAIQHKYIDVDVYIRSNAPEWIFKENLLRPVYYHNLRIDTGTYQKDFIHLDKKKSFTAYDQLVQTRDQLIYSEVMFLHANNIDLIVADIPPTAFYIASSAAIPAVALANFSWDWIFEPYLDEYPEYSYLIEDMRAGYKKADMLLRLPFAGDLSVFRKITDIPLILRNPLYTQQEVRRELGISEETRPVILCSFGGFNTSDLDIAFIMAAYRDFFFIGFSSEYQRGENYLLLPYNSNIDHPSLVACSAMVISKLGFSTVAECVGTGTPLMYISRDDFREYPVLEAGLKPLIPSYLIPRDNFFSGFWQKHLNTFMATIAGKPKEVRCPIDGSQQAATLIYKSYLS
ncbi:MAG: hypothetical protein RBU23_08300 [Candidatus Auribacterota bacterium]|jgi:hypothetical protein|nr:hypothetical protein [Candidatus Auribacterota bacterium]